MLKFTAAQLPELPAGRILGRRHDSQRAVLVLEEPAVVGAPKICREEPQRRTETERAAFAEQLHHGPSDGSASESEPHEVTAGHRAAADVVDDVVQLEQLSEEGQREDPRPQVGKLGWLGARPARPDCIGDFGRGSSGGYAVWRAKRCKHGLQQSWWRRRPLYQLTGSRDAGLNPSWGMHGNSGAEVNGVSPRRCSTVSGADLLHKEYVVAATCRHLCRGGVIHRGVQRSGRPASGDLIDTPSPWPAPTAHTPAPHCRAAACHWASLLVSSGGQPFSFSPWCVRRIAVCDCNGRGEKNS